VDVAHAAKVYAQRQKLGDEAIGYAHSIKVYALHKLGQMLKEMKPNKGASAGGRKKSPRGSYVEPRDSDGRPLVPWTVVAPDPDAEEPETK
jgi:hypothetical protein